MKVETLLAKFYDVIVTTPFENPDRNYAKVDGVVQIDIYEKGEDAEPIGWFINRVDSGTYEWRNVYGKVANGTIYSAPEVKAAAKAGAFYCQQ